MGIQSKEQLLQAPESREFVPLSMAKTTYSILSCFSFSLIHRLLEKVYRQKGAEFEIESYNEK